MTELNVNSAVAYFLKRIHDYPDEIIVGEIGMKPTREEEITQRWRSRQLRRLVAPVLLRDFSDPNSKLSLLAAEYLKDTLPLRQEGTYEFTLNQDPDSIDQVFEYFRFNGVTIPDTLKSFHTYFTH